ncbi:flagellin [Aureimonas sp. SK2]|uniref:flagellin N-terminal helical domain-containing protein n=1 Tax=Aureimonas sp. SK2 TaxID=3015992 RepID=UPI002443EF1B|nr:flagellin [Aureimonas sp. SK2]
MTSVNTNAAAITALRTLQSTNQQLDSTQARISTGLKIGSAKDNAAYWSISTTLKSDNKSLSTVKDALGLGAATVDVAYQGLNKAKDVLDEIKSKVTAATQDGVDRSKIQAEIAELQKQLKSIADSSVFSGENWLSVDSSLSTFNADKNVVASFSRAANGSVSIGTIGVNIGTVKLFDSNANADGILDVKVGMKDSAGNAMTVGGFNAGVDPSTAALNFSGTGTGATSTSAAGAVATLGTLNLAGVTAGDRLTFDLTVDGASGTVSLDTTGLTSANFASKLQQAVENAVGAGKATVKLGGNPAGTSGLITIEAASSGTASTITVGQTQVVDGDGVVTSTGGMLTGASLPAPVFGTSTKAAVDFGTYTAPTVDIASTDTYSFDVQYGSTVERISGTYGTDFAGAATANRPTAAEFATWLQGKIDTAFAGSAFNGTGATYTAGDIDVSENTGAFSLTSKNAGADQAIGLTSFSGTVNGAASIFGLDADSASSTAGQTGKVGYGTATEATLTIGTFVNADIKPNDRISFVVNVGGNQQTVTVSTEGLTGVLADRAADAGRLQTKVQTALNALYTSNAPTFAIDTTSWAMTLKTATTGPSAYLAIANVAAVNGDTVSSQKGGMTTVTAPTTTQGTDNSGATVASLVSGTAFAGPQTLGADDKISFDIAVNGATTRINIDKARVNTALGLGVNGSGTIGNVTDYATVLNSALSAALGPSVVTASGNTTTNILTLTKASAAGVGTIAVSNVASSAGADTMSIDKIDVTETTLASMGVNSSNRKDVFAAYISLVNDAINKVTTAASSLGSVASRIDMQKSFVNTLMDTIDKGVGQLVDADMTEESTKLQALQVKQQLGVQALSIANQSAQNVLSLFRG